jgi:hypothetical protein
MERLYVFRRLHQVHSPFRVAVLPHGAFDFRVTSMTNQDSLFPTTTGASDFHMHFGHQRAGGIKHGQVAAFRFVTYRL